MAIDKSAEDCILPAALQDSRDSILDSSTWDM